MDDFHLRLDRGRPECRTTHLGTNGTETNGTGKTHNAPDRIPSGISGDDSKATNNGNKASGRGISGGCGTSRNQAVRSDGRGSKRNGPERHDGVRACRLGRRATFC